LHLAPGQISRIERGVREIRLSTFIKLIDALDVEPNDLLAGVVKPRSV
jgi:DNA-binding Xre family transcriptional regulator